MNITIVERASKPRVRFNQIRSDKIYRYVGDSQNSQHNYFFLVGDAIIGINKEKKLFASTSPVWNNTSDSYEECDIDVSISIEFKNGILVP